MVRRLFVILGVCVCGWGPVVDCLAAQALPKWSPLDRARLKKGELVVGAALLVEDAREAPIPRVVPKPEVPPIELVEPEPEYDPTLLPQEYLVDYFETVPEGYLVDPQRLLSMQESLDREGFLEYHADDSEVDIRMYLFDAQQKIPEPYTLRKLIRDRYTGGDLTAVVFCFMGDPTRNLLALGGEGSGEVSEKDIRKMLESARIKALEKSDPATQVESFVVQLSIRLYWLEKERKDAEAELATVVAAEARKEPGKQRVQAKAEGVVDKVRPFLLYVVVGGVGAALAMFGTGAAWILWRRGRRYHFPVLEVPRRLGADYAAGVGAVLAFHDKLGSPSSQRDQVPDYLTRM